MLRNRKDHKTLLTNSSYIWISPRARAHARILHLKNLFWKFSVLSQPFTHRQIQIRIETQSCILLMCSFYHVNEFVTFSLRHETKFSVCVWASQWTWTAAVGENIPNISAQTSSERVAQQGLLKMLLGENSGIKYSSLTLLHPSSYYLHQSCSDFRLMVY